jgi:hypothetical protein
MRPAEFNFQCIVVTPALADRHGTAGTTVVSPGSTREFSQGALGGTIKPGIKLKSAVCDTEVMVIRASNVVVECGGVPMAEDRPADRPALDPAFAAGTKIGKRYVNGAGSVELLCVKAGKGSLSIGGEALKTKDSKPLPASD